VGILKKLSALLFGGDEKKQTAPRAAGKKKSQPNKKKNRPAPPPAGEKSGRKPEKKTEKKPDRKPKAKKPERPESAPAAEEQIVIPHPDVLEEVPPCEGKVRFGDFDLHKEVLFGVQAAGFKYCSPIQALALPELLKGRDLAGKAQTGTGKTAAFLLAVFDKLLKNPLPERKKGAPRVLILAPTRELAVQIHKDALQLGVFTGLRSLVVFGGMDHAKQQKSLDSVFDLLIGTPGRVIDYSRSRFLDLSRVEILIIDEADRMLDMGFIPDVKRIVSQLPKRGERQTMLFSATLSPDILRLSSGWLTDPFVVESEPEHLVSDNIEQTFYSVLREEKLALLLYIFRTETFERMIIFGNRKDVNLRLQQDLERYGYHIPVLSGDIPQEKRMKILERFRTGEEKIVIATDVAARGIHVEDISIVVNYDLPERAEDYIHRIGRTGRAGKTGKSISFLCEYGAYYLPAIEELLGVTFSSQLPTEEMLRLPPEVPGAKRPAKPAPRRPRRKW